MSDDFKGAVYHIKEADENFKGAVFHVKWVGGGGGGDQHNLGYYATQSALEEAHPTATDGDWAIVGTTDTVWVWDSDTNAWIDTGNAGIELPDQTGNAGKFLTTDGTDASWGNTLKELFIKSNNSNYYSIKLKSSGSASNGLYYVENNNEVAYCAYNTNNHTWILRGAYSNYFIFDELNACFKTNSTGGTLGNSSVKWTSVYTTKINNGADIAVPAVAGEMAVKQVNTTITLTAADWSSKTQTVNVTGMTATGVVLVSPAPADQADYVSAGILCTAQAAGTLTFTCDTVPSGDVDVNVVML